MLLEMFTHSGVLAKLGILIAFAPVVAAILYAIKPSERQLSLLRPLALAALFAGLSSFTAGILAVFEGMSAIGVDKPIDWRPVVLGTMETLVALFFAFGCLTMTWLLVALGMRRAS